MAARWQDELARRLVSEDWDEDWDEEHRFLGDYKWIEIDLPENVTVSQAAGFVGFTNAISIGPAAVSHLLISNVRWVIGLPVRATFLYSVVMPFGWHLFNGVPSRIVDATGTSLILEVDFNQILNEPEPEPVYQSWRDRPPML